MGELREESQVRREGAAREEEERGDTGRRRGVAREAGGSRRWRAVAVRASALATELLRCEGRKTTGGVSGGGLGRQLELG